MKNNNLFRLKNKKILIFNAKQPKEYFEPIKKVTTESLIFFNDPRRVLSRVQNLNIDLVILYTNENDEEFTPLKAITSLKTKNIPILVLVNNLLNSNFLKKLNTLKIPYIIQDNLSKESLLVHIKNQIVGHDLAQYN